MEGYFDKIFVKPGDVLFIPGGLPHAIGGGIFMVEIMEPSDLVVRFEFERAGYTLPESARFMDRGLEFCLDIFDFNPVPESLVRRKYMFEPRLEESYGDDSHRYHGRPDREHGERVLAGDRGTERAHRRRRPEPRRTAVRF